MTAQIVVTPIDEQATFRSSAGARDALIALQRDAEGSRTCWAPATCRSVPPHPAGSEGTVSPDGRVALIRVQYPVLEELSSDDLDNLKELAAADDGAAPLRIELGGDLLYAFEEPETGTGEALGLVVAVVILLLGVRFGRGDGPADRDGGLRHRPGRRLDVADHAPGRDPELGTGDRAAWSGSESGSTTRCSSSPGTGSTSPAG